MSFVAKTATALALVLTLAACGDAAEEADNPAVTETPAPVATAAAPDAAGTATPAPGETASPSPAATATTAAATPTPTPTPSASPTARATTAAAATKPAEFATCSVCHSTEPGKNGLGPTLAGVYGARAGHIDAFDYSPAMENSGLTWNQATLDRFLADPMGVVPGTKMAYPGLKDAAKRRAMIEYLKTL